MKTSILSIILMLLLLEARVTTAQSFIITPDSFLIRDTIAVNDQGTYYFNIENLLNTELELSWDLLQINFPQGWNYNLCDYLDCMLAPIPFHRNMEPIPALQQDGVYMKLWVSPENISGYGEWVFHVYETGHLNTGDTITYQITASGVNGIFESSAQNVSLYPNPATDLATIVVPGISNGEEITVRLIDNLGRTLISKKHKGSKILSLDISSISKGSYSLLIQDEQDLITKKLQIE